jgi:hypothetical protein
MAQDAFTVILNIKPDQVDAVTAVLTQIGQDIQNNSTLQFQATPSTHFARWVVLHPSEKSDPFRLLFSCWFDGLLKDYLSELAANIGNGIDTIWSYCEAYAPGCAKDAGRLYEFVSQNMVTTGFFRPQLFVSAFPGITAKRIQMCSRIREAFDKMLDTEQAQQLVKQVAKLLPPRPKAPPAAAETSTAWWSAPLTGIIDWLVGVKAGYVAPNTNVQTNQELLDVEDQITQNAMTIVSEITPKLIPRIVLRAALWRGHGNHATRFGTLSNVATIHLARWIIIDNGKNLLFESNYDGSWESYIDDFSDLASQGMDAIWGNCIGYPTGGSRDIEAFKKVIRDHQQPAQVFYSAYPNQTVTNIYYDMQVTEAVENLLITEDVGPFVAGTLGSGI